VVRPSENYLPFVEPVEEKKLDPEDRFGSSPASLRMDRLVQERSDDLPGQIRSRMNVTLDHNQGGHGHAPFFRQPEIPN
jgi:hypothetical protein